MYIEERGWVKAKVLLTNCYYIEKYRLVSRNNIKFGYSKFGF